MKTSITRFLCAVLLLTLVLGTAACTQEPEAGEQTDQQAQDTTAPATQEQTTQEETASMPIREIEQRYFIFRFWNFTPVELAYFKSSVDAAVQAGFNAIKVHIPWSRVESVAGQYDFSPFDPMIEYVVKDKGLKVAVSLDLTRRSDDTVIGLDQMQRDPTGKLCEGGSVDGKRTVISFCSESAVGAAVDFYTAAVQHYESLYSKDVLFYLPAFTQYAESEYWPAGEYDYSDLAINAFRAFLQEEYEDIDQLNYVLGTSYADFSEVQPPSCYATDHLGVLWYQFRHQKLKGFIDALAQAQKKIAPDSKLALQFGSHFDAASVLRCTLASGDLAEHADVVWIDDGPLSDHEFSMDYAVATYPAHVQLAQEIDGPLQNGATPERYLKQGNDAYSRGCTYLSIANWSINDDYRTYEWVWKQLSDTWLGENPPEMVDWNDQSRSMEIKLSQLHRKGTPGTFITEYYGHAPSGEFVAFKVIDDLSGVKLDQPQSNYLFPSGFSAEQGKENWYYMCTRPGRTDLIEMTYDTTNGRWQGKSEFSLIMKGLVHPDAYDAVLVFCAPKDGTISYSFSLSVDSPQSDGIQYRVFCNDTVLTKSNHSKGYISLPYGEVGQESMTIEVKKGDMLAIAINPGKTTANDSTSLSVEIEYQ